MDHAMAMEVPHARCNLSEVKRGQILLQVTFFSYLLEKTAISRQFQKQVNFVLIWKKSVHFENVRMIRVHLNFNFLDQLLLHVRLLKLFLVYYLNRKGESSFYFPCHKDISEPAFAEFSSDLKLIKGEDLHCRYFNAILALLSIQSRCEV